MNSNTAITVEARESEKLLEASQGSGMTEIVPSVERPKPVRKANGTFALGASGNPGGRKPGERALLMRMYGREGSKVYRRLEDLRNDPDTPRQLKANIDMWLIERLHGRAPQMVGVEVGPSLFDVLALAAARPVANGDNA